MEHSDFTDTSDSGFYPDSNLIPLNFGEGRRFEYFKARRYGIWQFIKKPSEKFKEDFLTNESLKKEFMIGISLNHPNVIRYIDYNGSELFQEYIEGDSLRELIDKEDKRIYDKDFILDLTKQMLEALQYIHSLGVVHNDIKPENIIVPAIGNKIKIIDFSCAVSSGFDIAGGFTPKYMAPEHPSGNTDASSDIYSLGIVVKELTDKSNLNKGWKKFIKKATDANPENRFRNEKEIFTTLPEKHNKFLDPSKIFLSILILCLVSVIVFLLTTEKENVSQDKIQPAPVAVAKENDNKNEAEEIQEENNEEYAVKTRQIIGNNVKPSPLPAVTNLEKDLKNAEKTIREYYIKEVLPVCESDDESETIYPNKSKLQESLQAAQANARKLGKILKEKYPKDKDYIDMEIYGILETCQTMVGMKYKEKLESQSRE